MALAWQQGPLAPGAVGHFLIPEPLPQRLLYAEPLRRRMRVRFGGEWIADREDVLLLHEPGHYPVAFFPLAAQVSAIRHKSPTEDWTGGGQPGAKRRDYASFADFADPDGNTWVLQEVGYRAPAPSASPS